MGEVLAVAVQPLVHTGSSTPGGGVTVTVFSSTPVVPAGTVPVSVYLTVPPGAMIGMSWRGGAVPLAAPHEVPVPVAVQVQVKEAPCNCVGKGSFTVAGSAVSGPPFVTAMV